ncbi:MAG: PAS domain-containing sensor histidine kinase [Ginsengibacter sp.]
MQNPSFTDFDRLAAIVKSSEDAIISRDLKGTITSWNPSAEKIFGYSAKEARGRHISIIIPEEFYEAEEKVFKNLKNGKPVQKYETIRKRKDGTRFFTSHIITPVKDAKKKVIGASKIISDISHQKNFYAAIINTSDDAICSKNLDGIITTWNHGAEKMFGYKEKEVLGRNITIIIPESKRKEEVIIRNKIRKGQRIAPIETIRTRKDGNEINISLTISPIYNQAGKISGASVISKDISRRVEIEGQHQVYTEKLEELNRYRDDFIAMASHELKTPLTVLKVNLQILEEIVEEDESAEFIQSSCRQVDKLTDLISHLLDASKIQAGNIKLNYSTFSLKTLLKEINLNIRPSNQGHKTVMQRINKDIYVHADRERIEHVVNNLLLNAIKYSPDSENIVVKAVVKNDFLQVSVKDEGIGIPAAELEKIFERFYRVAGMPSTYSGSGIGLFICAEIIKWHGGKIWAESELGKGSTFYFQIPMQRTY